MKNILLISFIFIGFGLYGQAYKTCCESSATFETVDVDQTFEATFGLDAVDIHDNGSVVLLNDKILDAGWSRSANVVSYTGTPEKVTGYVSINAPEVDVANYWSRPKLRVLRNGTQIAVIDDLTMQQNTAYDGDGTINGVFFDKQPGANPAYTFEWYDQDARTTELPPVASSQIALVATIKIQVLTQ